MFVGKSVQAWRLSSTFFRLRETQKIVSRHCVTSLGEKDHKHQPQRVVCGGGAAGAAAHPPITTNPSVCRDNIAIGDSFELPHRSGYSNKQEDSRHQFEHQHRYQLSHSTPRFPLNLTSNTATNHDKTACASVTRHQQSFYRRSMETNKHPHTPTFHTAGVLQRNHLSLLPGLGIPAARFAHTGQPADPLTDSLTDPLTDPPTDSGSGIVDMVTSELDSMTSATVFFQDVLLSMHATTGLPWWGCIVLMTCVLRGSLTAPLYIYQQKTIAKYTLLQPTIKEWAEAIKYKVYTKSKKEGKSAEEATKIVNLELKAMHKRLMKENSLHPLWMRAQLPIFMQIPVFILFSFSLRGLSDPMWQPSMTILDELSVEGTLWFSNLAVPDVWYGLPLIIGMGSLLNMEMMGLTRVQQPKDQLSKSTYMFREGVTGFLRLLSVGMVVIASQVPSALALYWASSSIYGFFQSFGFLHQPVRRAFGIPKTSRELENPTAHMLQQARTNVKDFVADVKKNNAQF